MTCSADNAGIHAPKGVKLVIDNVLDDTRAQLTATGGGGSRSGGATIIIGNGEMLSE